MTLEVGEQVTAHVARGYAELARINEYYRPGDDLVVYGKYLTTP